jgi:hypothetical protein
MILEREKSLHNEKWNEGKKNRVDEIKLRIFFFLLFNDGKHMFFGPFFGTRIFLIQG